MNLTKIERNGLIVIGAITLILILLAIASRPSKQALTCLQEKSEWQVVASIANATGRLPGDPHTYIEPRVSVNPNFCNND